jgi:DNA-binding transcriptional regulator YdaS (Cro superfamily)
MTLQEYLKHCSKEERRQLWQGSRSRRAYLYNLSKSLQRQKAGLPKEPHDRIPSPSLAIELEKLTKGKVTRADLRPDLWGD